MSDNRVSEFEHEHENNLRGQKKIRSIRSIILVSIAVLLVFFIVNARLSARNNNYLTQQTEGWIAGVGSCCSTGTAEASIEQLENAGVDYYAATYGQAENLEASVEDFGCHQEITITQDGRVVKRFGYAGGSFYEIAR